MSSTNLNTNTLSYDNLPTRDSSNEAGSYIKVENTSHQVQSPGQYNSQTLNARLQKIHGQTSDDRVRRREKLHLELKKSAKAFKQIKLSDSAIVGESR